MSNFLTPYGSGLLYKIMHRIIFNPDTMIFGRLVPR